MLNNPVFIVGAHKSGTSLLRNLLDGHPDLFSIPVETHYFQNTHHWVDNEYRWQRPKHLSNEEITDRLCAWIHRCNTSEDKIADTFAKGIFNEDGFREYLTSGPELKDDRSWISRYFESIHYAIYGKELAPGIRIVEKSVENAEFVWELSHLFPDAKFIHILRNPYANIVALRKYQARKFGYPILRRTTRTLYNNYYYLYKNRKLLNQYYIVRYRDLVSQPEKQIKSLCKFLSLKFDPILLEPTFLGEPWKGNSTSGKTFNGISDAQLENWKNEIKPVEAIYVNKLFPFILSDFDYRKYQTRGGFWKPVKGENLRRYLANRFYPFLLQEWKSVSDK